MMALHRTALMPAKPFAVLHARDTRAVAGRAALVRRSRPVYRRAAAVETVETKELVDDVREFVADELPRVFATGALTKSWYADNMKFEDPLTKFDSFTGYSVNIQILRALFDIKFDLHETTTIGVDQVSARWTLEMVAKAAPWKPTITITGQSFYRIDQYTGKIISHIDLWDCLGSGSTFPSLEAVLEVARQLTDTTFQQTPDLGTPQYSVLLRTAEYEIRRYEPYLVAETPMPKGTGVSGGAGFNELAGYIFGGNQDNVKMEMTTPVFTETNPGQAAASMQFVLEPKFGSTPDMLPAPSGSSKVSTKATSGSFTAAARFSGLAFDWDVRQQELQLRLALEAAGYRCAPGYRLARYNDPFVLPMFRRNEVLIDLEDFKWV